MSDAQPYTVPLPGGIPPDHKPHTESKTTILLPKAGAFLNPPQQFNRDLSVAVIRAWNERRKETLEARYKARLEKGKGKKNKGKGKAAQMPETADAPSGTPANGEAPEEETMANGNAGAEHGSSVAGPSTPKPFRATRITILEALSATGLRSIRYAKEIPDIKYVLANDLSPSACDAMRMNVAYNGVGESSTAAASGSSAPVPSADAVDGDPAKHEAEGASGPSAEEKLNAPDVGRREGCEGQVRVTEGDACDLMAAHRHPKDRVDIVDLDPYGTAAPFIDSAVSCLADGGLLCITCTDTAIFAGNAYPEKAFSNYGGVCVNAEYRHEVGLRLILNAVASAAARYGRYITPLLSFSIDFYARLFITISTGPAQVKDLASQTGIIYACSNCSNTTIQPFCRVVEKENSIGQPIKNYKLPQKTSLSPQCDQCEATYNVGGPMWLGPIQDSDFARRVLDSIKDDKEHYGTWPRMKGMLTLAESELADPFYFTLNRVASHFHATSPSSNIAVNALLNAGYNVSRSHACAGSLKTNAPWSFIYDIVREFVKTSPVRMDKLSENSRSRNLLAKPQQHEINVEKHPEAYRLDKAEKVVYYQENPTQHWGPATRAKSFKAAPQTQSTAGKAVDSGVSGAAGTEIHGAAKRKIEGGPEEDAKKQRSE